METSSLSGIRQTSEAAWMAWLKSVILPGTPLAPANITSGQSTEELVLPALIVACNNAVEKHFGTGYYEADVDLMVMSSPDVGKDASGVQAAMVGQLESFLVGVDPGNSASQQAIGKAVAVVAVANNIPYTVYGFWVEDQTGQIVERHWVDLIKLKVHCAAASGLAPDFVPPVGPA